MIGNDIFLNFILIGQVKLNDQGLLLQKTKLGWILAGSIQNSSLVPRFNTVCCNLIQYINVKKQIVKFRELEEHLDKKSKSIDEKLYELLYVEPIKKY